MSGICKSPVAGTINISKLGIEGDEQADLSAHGGLSKAVYAYPSEHYPFWRTQTTKPDFPYGRLGENLTLSGLLEKDVFVGDELHFPDCVLRITEPRQPCYKLNAHLADNQAAKQMVQTGFCGFYLAVESPGSIMAGQSFVVVPGQRQLPMMALFKAARAKSR